MSETGSQIEDDKSHARTSVKAMSALYKLLGWITIGVGFGFAVTLFTFSAGATTHTDMIISIAAGLICLMLTVLIFVITYGLSEVLKMMVDVGESTGRLASELESVVDRIEIVSEEQASGPSIEEIESPPSQEDKQE